MVKIEFTAEAGFRLVDRGLTENRSRSCESLRVEGKGGVGFNGSIRKDLDIGVYSVRIQLGFLHTVEIKAEKPGLDSVIDALNGYDWSNDLEKYQEGQFENALIDIPYEEIKEKTWFDRYWDAKYQKHSVGLTTWYINRDQDNEISNGDMCLRQMWDISELPNPYHESNIYSVIHRIYSIYECKDALIENGTAELYLNGYKRKSVVGLTVGMACAVLKLKVWIKYRDLAESWRSNMKVMEGDNLAALEGDYASVLDVEYALSLNRLCGNKIKPADVDWVTKSNAHGIQARFAKNLHSEVAANLKSVVDMCKALKLKGLIEGPSLTEAIAAKFGITGEQLKMIMSGHKEKHLPHAIWAAKKGHSKGGLQFSFSGKFGGTKMYPLAPDALENLYIGDLTGCCQHLDGVGEDVCKEGWKRPGSQNWVFRSESDAIVAHTWVWLDDQNNLVLDSVEARSYASKEEIATLIGTFAKAASDEGYTTLLSTTSSGIGRSVAEILSLSEKAKVSMPSNGKKWSYSDCKPGREAYVVK